MIKYVCLRDDDTNYYTDYDVLKWCYGDIWGCIPITLATIPFIHGSSKKMEEFDPVYSLTDSRESVSSYDKKEQYKKLGDWEKEADWHSLTDYHTVHPIGANIVLIEELSKMVSKGLLEIAQHGVFHRFTFDGPEMISSRMTKNLVADGKSYLERVFNCKIHTFIPPSNTIDEGCAHYVQDLGMNLFCSGGIKYTSIRKKFFSFIKHPGTCLLKIRRKISHKRLPISYVSGMVLFDSITYDPFKNKESLYNKVNSQLNETGFVSLGTHYSLLERIGDYRKDYLEVIERLKTQKDTVFVTASDYYKKLMEKNKNE